jgi:hypothetical protein
VIKNLLIKYESLEREIDFYDTFISKIYGRIETSYNRMKQVDRIGAFQSDDETGVIFNEMKMALDEINNEFNLDNGSQEKE